MSQWAKLSELCNKLPDIHKHITAIFSSVKFPFEVRHQYANWIESQPWLDLNTDLEEDNAKGEKLYNELMLFLEQDVEDADFCNRLSVEQQKTKLKELAESHISDFIKAVKHFLKAEMVLIESALCSDEERTRRSTQLFEKAKENEDLKRRNIQLAEKIRNANAQVQEMRMKQDKMIMDLEDLNTTVTGLKQQIEKPSNGARLAELRKSLGQKESDIQLKWHENYYRRDAAKDQYLTVATELTLVLKAIWQEVDKWKHDKKLYMTGLSKPKEGAVELLNELCEEGGAMLMSVVQGVQNIIHIYNACPYQDNNNEQIMTTMMKELEGDYMKEHLKRVFVVDKNPQQVLKVSGGKTLGFSMSVRILGGNALALQMNPPKVTAKLFHERNLSDAMQDAISTQEVCNIVNGKEKTMEYEQKNKGKTGQWVCNFTSVQLTKVRRVHDKTNDERVTEHKYGMIFCTDVKIRDKSIALQVLSLPIVLTSQTSQECMAKGTLIWDGAFSQENRTPYQDPDEIEWGSVAMVLDALFRQSTGRGLTDEHLRYLAKVAFRDKDKDNTKDFSRTMITKTKLIKDKLPHRDFSFWKWFFCCLNLIKEHLQKEWKESLIYGFLSKEEAVAKLIDKPYGTFLLRFSESDIENSQRADICGHLTVAVIEMNPERACPKVYYVKENLSPKDLNEKGLAAILEAFQVNDPNTQGKKRLLTSLWPGRDFFQVFLSYITQKEKDDSIKDFDYKRGKFRIEIDLGSSGHGVMNGGATPTHSMVPMSPMSPVSPMMPMTPLAENIPRSPSMASETTDDTSYSLYPGSPFSSQASPPVAQVAPMQSFAAPVTPEFPQGAPPVGANVVVERVLDTAADDTSVQDQTAALDTSVQDQTAALTELLNTNDPQALAAMINSMNVNGILSDEMLNMATEN